MVPDEYKKYQQSAQSYALITGATDGIGKSLAKDLYQKGFNLIIHGRNEEKLKAAVEEITVLREGGVIESFLADATSSDVAFAAIAERFSNLDITLFINNVGGGYVEPKRFEGWSESDLLTVVRWNALFSAFLTQAFLPSLRKTSLSHPVLVAFHGSFAAELPAPRFPLGSASRAFVRLFSAGLNADERFTTGESNIKFMHLYTGTVQSSTITAPAGVARPTSDEYAALIVKVLGCGRAEVVPYFVHMIILTILRGLPAPLLRHVLRTMAKGLLVEEAKKSKAE